MRKLLFILLAASMVSLVATSCTKEEENVVEDIEEFTVQDEIDSETMAEDMDAEIEDELELKEFKKLRKEWNDGDFV